MTNEDEARRVALAEKLVARAEDRLRTGVRSEWKRLPESKQDYPKLLCLDQNKWIDLGRAHYGRDDGVIFRPALDAVREAIAKDTLVVPITAANVYEAAEPANEARRERLARFMVELSANHSLVNHTVVMREELRRATARHYLKREPRRALRAGLMQPGHYAATMGKYPKIETGDPDLDQFVRDAMYDPELAVAAIVGGVDRATVARLREEDRNAMAIVEKIREIDAKLSPSRRRQLELKNLLADGATASMLIEVLMEVAVAPDAFHAWLASDDNLNAFAADVPGIDVTATLMLHRDLNRAHRTHPNDGKDFSFLQVAIPYANFVVAEKSWTHFAVASGLAKRHDTLIVTDATTLPDILAAAGCI